VTREAASLVAHSKRQHGVLHGAAASALVADVRFVPLTAANSVADFLQWTEAMRERLRNTSEHLREAELKILGLQGSVGRLALNLTRVSRNLTHVDADVRESSQLASTVGAQDVKLNRDFVVLENTTDWLETSTQQVLDLENATHRWPYRRTLDEVEATLNNVTGMDRSIKSLEANVSHYRQDLADMAQRIVDTEFQDFYGAQQQAVRDLVHATGITPSKAAAKCCSPPCHGPESALAETGS